jgi:hypothetical protein
VLVGIFYSFAAAGGLGALGSGVAQTPVACTIRVATGAGSEAPWISEATNLEHRIRTEWGTGDCMAVEVHPDPTGAWIEFRGRDGTVARRHLAGSRELAPTVRALLVRVDADYFAGVSPLHEEKDEAVAPPPGDKDAPAGATFTLGAALGVRAGIGGGTPISTPVFGGFAALQMLGWEVGLLAQWETGYRQAVVDQEPDWSASAFTMGVSAGRRIPAGGWDLVTGVQFAQTIVKGSTDDEDPHISAEGSAVRLGAYFGVVGPRAAHLRMRTMLGVDVVPQRFGAAMPIETSPADLPAWMATLSFGIEARVP